MIETIRQFRINVETWQASLHDVVLKSVKDNEAAILDLNIEDQLFQQGIDSEGQAITPGYSPLTISIKRQKSQPTDRVTLRDTGDFHRSFEMSYGNDAFGIYATDPKSQSLERKYGKEIFGLTDKSLQEAIDITKPDIQQRSKRIIFQNLNG